MRKTSFTLLETLVVIIIVGMLVTLAISHYSVFREKSFDKTAQSTLQLIAAAEKIYRTEVGFYYPLNSTATTADLNADLHLSISRTSAAWDYTVSATSDTIFSAQADRTAADQDRYWCMNSTSTAPFNGTCP